MTLKDLKTTVGPRHASGMHTGLFVSPTTAIRSCFEAQLDVGVVVVVVLGWLAVLGCV